jgi:NitT/TauT family transport system substrate-binding protein
MTGVRLAICATLAFACLAQAAAALDDVNVGKSGPPMLLSLVELGQDTGIWTGVGLHVNSIEFAGEAKTMQALAAGSIDLGFGSGAGLAFVLKGVPATAVAAVSGPPYMLVLAVAPKSLIVSVDDLKGRTIGVSTVGSLTEWVVHELSRKMGWGNDGIKSLPIGGASAAMAALDTGQIDGAVVGEAFGRDSEDRGRAHVLLSFGDRIGTFHSNVLFASNALIARDPRIVERFLAGWFKIVVYARAHPDEGAKVGARTLGVSLDAATKAYDDEVLRMASDDGAFNPAAVEVVRRSLKEMGVLDTVPPASALYSTRFVPARN